MGSDTLHYMDCLASWHLGHHRSADRAIVVDGRDAASFMQALKSLIENPLRLLSA